MPNIAQLLLKMLAYLFFWDCMQDSGAAEGVGQELASGLLVAGVWALVVVSLLALSVWLLRSAGAIRESA